VHTFADAWANLLVPGHQVVDNQERYARHNCVEVFGLI
jgi:hypothetical protein